MSQGDRESAVCKVNAVLRGCPEQKAIRDRRDLQASRVRKATQGLTVRQVRLDRQVLRDRKGKKATQEYLHPVRV